MMFPCLCSGVRTVGRVGPGPLVSALITAGYHGVRQQVTPPFNLVRRVAAPLGVHGPWRNVKIIGRVTPQTAYGQFDPC